VLAKAIGPLLMPPHVPNQDHDFTFHIYIYMGHPGNMLCSKIMFIIIIHVAPTLCIHTVASLVFKISNSLPLCPLAQRLDQTQQQSDSSDKNTSWRRPQTKNAMPKLSVYIDLRTLGPRSLKAFQ
jgi:hypothetical protein